MNASIGTKNNFRTREMDNLQKIIFVEQNEINTIMIVDELKYNAQSSYYKYQIIIIYQMEYNSGTNVIRKLMQDDSKYREKIEGKEFLLGKFQTTLREKLNRKIKKPKRLNPTRFAKLLKIQYEAQDKPSLDYNSFANLHQLWKGYIHSLINQEKNEDNILLRMLRADFHGAHIVVIASKIKSYEGLEGIVIRQTLRTFQIITQQGKTITIIKANSVFLMQINDKNFKIYGCNLVFRPTDRIKHKFKYKKASDFVLQN